MDGPDRLIKMTKTRLETYSDSVMAIVITLLAFELKTPVENSLNNFETFRGLIHLLPEFLVFVLSFLTISIMWINHHYITSKIKEVNHRTVWANSTLLLFVCLIPFATSFLASNPNNQVALITYSVVMFLCSLTFSLLKMFSVPSRTRTHHKEKFRHVGLIFYSLSAITAFFVPQLAYLLLLVPPLSYTWPKNL